MVFLTLIFIRKKPYTNLPFIRLKLQPIFSFIFSYVFNKRKSLFPMIIINRL